jgi:hypothetical protein
MQPAGSGRRAFASSLNAPCAEGRGTENPVLHRILDADDHCVCYGRHSFPAQCALFFWMSVWPGARCLTFSTTAEESGGKWRDL